MIRRINHFEPGQIVRTKKIMDNDLLPIWLQEFMIAQTTPKEAFGLIYSNEYPFKISIVGNTLRLKSIQALLASGHLVSYKNKRDYGPLLEVSLQDKEAGSYFVYLHYKGMYLPVVSKGQFGRTNIPDIQVPAYQLNLKPDVLPLDDFPNCLLLGQINIPSAEYEAPELETETYPLIGQMGGHSKSEALLQKTKAQLPELIKAAEEVLGQLHMIPKNSIFMDLRELANAQLCFYDQYAAVVRQWSPSTSLFECFCFWSGLAQIYRRWLLTERLAGHQATSLNILYQRGAAGGQIYIEHYLLPTVNTLSDFQYDVNQNDEVITLIEQMISYVTFPWLMLGDGTQIVAPQHLQRTNSITS